MPSEWQLWDEGYSVLRYHWRDVWAGTARNESARPLLIAAATSYSVLLRLVGDGPASQPASHPDSRHINMAKFLCH